MSLREEAMRANMTDPARVDLDLAISRIEQHAELGYATNWFVIQHYADRLNAVIAERLSKEKKESEAA